MSSSSKRKLMADPTDSVLQPKTPYMHFKDRCKQDDVRKGCVFLAEVEGHIIAESLFRNSDGVTVFATEVIATKEAVSDGRK